MFITEIFSGRYETLPRITSFPNITDYDQLYTTGPIAVRSTCAHHMQPIVGKCYIGVFPGKHVIGLSKFNRIVRWIVQRPQIQEEMTMQIADKLEKITKAAKENTSVMIPIIEASLEYATLGEIVDSMKSVYGEWTENISI